MKHYVLVSLNRVHELGSEREGDAGVVIEDMVLFTRPGFSKPNPSKVLRLSLPKLNPVCVAGSKRTHYCGGVTQGEALPLD